MTIKELMDRLSMFNPDLPVMISTGSIGGCDTCGYGAEKQESDIYEISDLETRIVLEYS
jgi:hypothetical protein